MMSLPCARKLKPSDIHERTVSVLKVDTLEYLRARKKIGKRREISPEYSVFISHLPQAYEQTACKVLLPINNIPMWERIMPSDKFHKINRFTLSNIFSNELEFSTYLRDNIEILDEKIPNINFSEIEVNKEEPIGEFRVDLSGQNVIIENQFGARARNWDRIEDPSPDIMCSKCMDYIMRKSLWPRWLQKKRPAEGVR